MIDFAQPKPPNADDMLKEIKWPSLEALNLTPDSLELKLITAGRKGVIKAVLDALSTGQSKDLVMEKLLLATAYGKPCIKATGDLQAGMKEAERRVGEDISTIARAIQTVITNGPGLPPLV